MTAPANAQALQPLATWWRGLAERERRLVALAGALLAAAALWMLAVQPAWRTLQRAPLEIERLEAELQAMQRLAAEATTLRAAPPVSPEQASTALQAATARLGDQGKLALQGNGRAVLTVNNIGSGALRDWLAEARAGARAKPLEATLNRGAQGYSGTLVLAIGGAP
jgi:general secretion pathway protein M